MGLKRYRKKITRQVKATAKQVGPTVIQVAGAVAAPVTGGASLLASQAYAQGKRINEAQNDAKRIEKENARIVAENEAYYASLDEAIGSAKSEQFAAVQMPPRGAESVKLAGEQKPGVAVRFWRWLMAGA